MNQIKIQTKIKTKPKSIDFTGTYVPNKSIVILNFCSNIISNFIKNLQKNQKLELIVDSQKIGNIRNLVVTKSHTGHKPELEFESIFLKQEKTSKIVDIKTSLQIFCDQWQRFDKSVDLHDILRSVFQIDPRMFLSYNFKTDDEKKEILEFAQKLINKKIGEL